jgi:hypothetical protein
MKFPKMSNLKAISYVLQKKKNAAQHLSHKKGKKTQLKNYMLHV